MLRVQWVRRPLRPAGALKGFLQDALVGRAHLSETEGGSQGWSGAEVPGLHAAGLCRGWFLAAAHGRQQGLEGGFGQAAGQSC